MLLYRVLGPTGLRVSVISYGVYSLTGMYGPVGMEEALSLLRYARELGINLFDTGDVYGYGMGEEILRRALGDGIEEAVVATKIGYDFYSSKERPARRYDEKYLRFAAGMSAKRLGKRPIDLLQLHNPPLEVLKKREVYRTAKALIDEGLIEHFGIALGPEVDVLPQAMEALKHDEVEVLQFVYNALEQEPGRVIAKEARKHGVGVMVRVPHAGGVLDETIGPDEAEGLRDHRMLRRQGWFKWAFKAYRAMKEKLGPLPGTPGQKALKFIDQTIRPDSIVVIAKDRETLSDYTDYTKIKDLPGDVIEYIKKIYDQAIWESPEIPASLKSRVEVG